MPAVSRTDTAIALCCLDCCYLAAVGSGECVCNNCSLNRMLIKHIDTSKKQRVCDNCFAKSEPVAPAATAAAPAATTSSSAAASASSTRSAPAAAATTARAQPAAATPAVAASPRAAATTAAPSSTVTARATAAVRTPVAVAAPEPAVAAPVLPPGWNTATAADGKVYYYHEDTGETSYVCSCGAVLSCVACRG